MTRTIDDRRAAVVAEAMTWEGTPYIPHGAVKGRNGGVDCLTFLVGVYEATNEIPKQVIPSYPHDWHLNQPEERYMNAVLQFCDEVDREPLPGDIILFQFGKCYSHGAIALDWPRIIHAWSKRPVGPDDYSKKTVLKTIHESIPNRGKPRPKKVFTLKEWNT